MSETFQPIFRPGWITVKEDPIGIRPSRQRKIMPALTNPCLTITGHYDGDQNGAMDFYKEHMLYGNQKAKDEHYLIIGPWDHAGHVRPENRLAVCPLRMSACWT